MRVLDLFSGIGGFSLGLRMAGGFETVQFVEIEPYCQKVLAKNFPGVPIHGDIRTFRPVQGSASVVAGGFPCQPWSVAGKRLGSLDDRALWAEMERVIATVRPDWVIGENVAGIIQVGLDEVLSAMDGLGYTSQTFVIPACAVDAPHRRDRVWIVAHSSGGGLQGGQKARNNGSNWPQPDDQHPTGRGGVPSPDRTGEVGWLPEPGMGRVAHGIPHRVDRLRGLGNAVVPQVVAEIGKAILNAERLAA